jgi:hypothetical protein
MAFPRLQWRDRAGLSPDFPIKPLRAPENYQGITSDLVTVKFILQPKRFLGLLLG